MDKHEPLSKHIRSIARKPPQTGVLTHKNLVLFSDLLNTNRMTLRAAKEAFSMRGVSIRGRTKAEFIKDGYPISMIDLPVFLHAV